MRLASYIRVLGYPADIHSHSEGAVLFPNPMAVDTGLGEVGRNGMLMTKEYGPAVRITIVSTTLPMVVDKPCSTHNKL